MATLIGPGKHHEKRVKVIGRWVHIKDDAVELYPDDRYIAQALEAYGMQDCKPVAAPATKDMDETAEDRKALLLRRLLEEKRPRREGSGGGRES